MNMMNVSDISESLGFKVTTDFIEEALIKHIGSCLPSKAPKRPSKAEAKKADPAPADDEDY